MMGNLPQRKRTRLAGYDYSQSGAYFITICTHHRQQIFGNVVGNGLDRSATRGNVVGNGLDRSATGGNVVGNGLDRSEIVLTQYGKIAEKELLNIPFHFNGVEIKKYVIMPNHIHAIIFIGCVSKTERSRPFPTVSAVVGLYKSGVSKIIHQKEPDSAIWQKSFHDHIIRNEQEYQKIWQYIDTNPLNWEKDCFFETPL